MLKMVDGTGIIGVDMICPLGVSTPQPPNYDRVELEGTGMLVLPNSLDAPLERLELGGKTEQVQTTGAQLLKPKDGSYTVFGVSVDIANGEIKLSGTATSSGGRTIRLSEPFLLKAGTYSSEVVGKNLFDVNYFAESENYQNKEGDATYWKYATFKVKPNTTYTVSKRKSLNVNGAINNGIYYGGALAFNNDVNSVKITTKDDGVFYVIFFYRSEDVNILKEMDIQIELGETLTEYEPYKEQTLTLTSDRPITKWDKLVEQGGQIGWLYQSSKMILDGTKIKWLHSNKPENSYFATTIIDAYGGKGASFCKTYRNIQDSAYVIKYANERCIYSDHPTYTSGDKFFRAPNENVTTLEQWKEFIDENPIEMLYHTKNSEFVPLPQSEQNAIRALTTHYPTTVITADGGELDPDIKVTYRKEI